MWMISTKIENFLDKPHLQRYNLVDNSITMPCGDGFSQRLAEAISTLAASAELRKSMGDAEIEFAADYDKNGYFGSILKAINITLYQA